MVGIGRSRRHGDGTLTSLVTHQAAFYALGKNGAEGAAKEGFLGEGTTKDSAKEVGQTVQI